jgi:hypothetical protein
MHLPESAYGDLSDPTLSWHGMAKLEDIEDIEKAVAELPGDQPARFRAWFEEFEASRFDQKIERDASEGRLDRLAEQALSDFRAGRAREL